MIKPLFVLLVALGLCCACTTRVSVHRTPKLDMARYHRVFVVQPFNENHHVDEIFVNELRQTGRIASSGPLTMMPEDTDAVLVYHAQWTGDFFISLLDLSVELHTAHTDKPLAQANYYQPSARPKSPEYVVHSVVSRIFGP